MRTLSKELVFGVRALRRMPGSAVVSVVVLALGIGLCSFMFSVVWGVYFRGFDVPDSGRVYAILTTQPERDVFQRPVPLRDLLDWRERQSSFTGLLGASGGTVNLGDARETRRYQGGFVTANAFDVLGVPPLLGRGFAEGEDAPGSPRNVVLGHAVWVVDFGSDPGVVGRAVRVNGEPAEIIGVMPEGFAFPGNAELWIPLTDDPLATARGEGPSVMVYGRLRDGVTRERADFEMAAIADQLAVEFPESNEGFGARLETPARVATGGPLNVIFGAMMIAVLCVLLVACANVANLLLARAATRTREAALRASLGAGRLQVMAPFFAEAAVLAGAGALLGVVVAQVAVTWFDGITDPALTGRPWFIRFELDWPILGFVVALAVFTALAAGLAPALQMSRTDVNGVLKDESRGSSGLRLGRLSHVLVTAEVALSCALLVATGLMTKSIVNLGRAERPYETERLFTARVGLLEGSYPDDASRQRFWEDLRRELSSVPGIARVALGSQLPMSGENRRRIAVEGVAYEDPEAMPSPNRVVVSPGFFETLGVTLVSGRDFEERDAEGTERVAIVNRPMAERYFGGTDPVGVRFREGAADTLPRLTVIGVVGDLDVGGPFSEAMDDDFEPAGYYVPLRQTDASFLSIAAVPRAGDPLALTSDVRAAVRRIDPDLPVFNVRTEAEVIERRTWFYHVFGTVFIVFGLAALFMASVGLYGVLSFAVSRRTQEMGIRMALGAGTREVVGLVARQGAAQLGIGLAVGLALAYGLTRAIGLLMYRVDPRDPLVFGAVLATIVVVAAAAAFFPALRATRVEPVEALRYE